jgi:hypothetical protein
MPGALSGQRLYDALYANGYHNKTTYSHSEPLVSELRAHGPYFSRFRVARVDTVPTRSPPEVDTVLDVGCSHGLGVVMLWNAGFKASGVDVSHHAIARARKRANNRFSRCNDPCFQQASATALPYANRSFDAVVSTDVLEHLEPSDVSLAVGELSRVARRMLLLKISNRKETDTKDLSLLKARLGDEQPLPDQLHSLIRGPLFWLDHFERHGWLLDHMLEGRNKGLTKAHWECCSYILVHSSAHPNPRKQQIATRHEIKRMEAEKWWRDANACLHWGYHFCR